jgi:tetratricopeptide (TPR) repeat protein
MRSLTWMSMAFAALLAVLPSAARADKILDECTGADGSRAYEACQAILKRGVAESAYNRAIAYSYLGRLTYISGDFHGAIAFYTEAIRLDPTMAEAYAGRGWVHHASGEYEPARSRTTTRQSNLIRTWSTPSITVETRSSRSANKAILD